MFPHIQTLQSDKQETAEQQNISRQKITSTAFKRQTWPANTLALEETSNRTRLREGRPSAATGWDHLRIVLLGKSGSGKSSLANTIFGETVFEIGHTANPETSQCRKATRVVNGTSVSIIDTPGFFDNRTSEEELRNEITRSVIECSPGPHAFLILLKVERYTDQEIEVITKIKESFSEEVFRYAVLVFTHGDNLPEGMQIEEFCRSNNHLLELLERCGGRCHVFDNRYWINNPQDDYRNNQLQRENLLNTIKEMVRNNGGGCYTNEMLQEVERQIQQQQESIGSSSGDMSWEEIREEAKKSLYNILKMAAGITTGMLLGALLGVPIMIAEVTKILKGLKIPIRPVMKAVVAMPPAAIAGAVVGGLVGGGLVGGGLVGGGLVGGGAVVGGAVVGGLVVGGAVVEGAVVGGAVVGGAVVGGAVGGGYVGYREADEADSIMEGVRNTAKTLGKLGLQSVKTITNTETEQSTPLIKRD